MLNNSSPPDDFLYPQLNQVSLLMLADSLQFGDQIAIKNYIKRDVEQQLYQYLLDPEILVLRGPRQAGKTTIIKSIGKYLQDKYGKSSVYFFTLEDDLFKERFIERPQQLIRYLLELNSHQKIFVLLDEVQYIKAAGKILKLIYDVFPQVKIIVTGSSTLDLNQLGEFLVGRALFFEISPLSFKEFLATKDKALLLEYTKQQFQVSNPKVTQAILLPEFNQILQEYLSYGGYPRVVLEKDVNKKIFLLRNIYSTYIEKDIIKLYGHQYQSNTSKLKLLKFLSNNIGQLVQYHQMSKVCGLNFSQLKKILEMFEQTYLIKRVNPYYLNQTTELKKNPKYYFVDLGMRNVLLEQFEFNQTQTGKLLENFVFNSLWPAKMNFWRTTAKAEVDLILSDTQTPVEVKTRPVVTRSLMSYLNRYQPKIAIVVNHDVQRVIKKNQSKIYYVPAVLL